MTNLTIQQCEILIREIKETVGKVPNSLLKRTLDNLKAYIDELSNSPLEDVLDGIEDTFDVVTKTKAMMNRRDLVTNRRCHDIGVTLDYLERSIKSDIRVASLVLTQSKYYSKVVETFDKDGTPMLLMYPMSEKRYFQSNLKVQKDDALYGGCKFMASAVRKRADQVRSRGLRATRKAKYGN